MFVIPRYTIQIDQKLDRVIEDDIPIDKLFRKPDAFIQATVHGFAVAHSACTTWKMLRLGSEQWPTNISIWFIYAKFIAVYPEETQVLVAISNSIVQNRIKGSFEKLLIEQIHSLVRQREPNLSPDLKDKISALGKKVQTAKHHMRHVWDTIIQGNFHESVKGISRACASQEKTMTEFQHVLNRYPNNRFITRAYSRFLLEVVGDLAGFEAVDAKTKLLQKGLTANEDQAHEFGMLAFPLLPDTVRSTMNTGANYSTVDGEGMSEVIIESPEVAVEVTTAVSQQIEKLKIPSVTLAYSLRPIVWFVCFVCVIVALLIYFYVYFNIMSRPLDYISQLSAIRMMVSMLPLLSQRLVEESLQCVPPQLKFPSDTFFSLPSADTRAQLQYFLTLANEKLLELVDFQSYKIGVKELDAARQLIFSDMINYQAYMSVSYAYPRNITVYSGVLDLVFQAQSILQEEALSVADLGGQPVLNQVMNTELIMEPFSSALINLVSYLTVQDRTIKKTITYVIVVLDVVIVVVWIAAVVFIQSRINRDQKIIFIALSSLPKNIVSTVADRLKVLKKDATSVGESSMNTNSAIGGDDLSKQEENMLKIFATAGDSVSRGSNLQMINYITMLFSLLFYIAASVLLTFMLFECSRKIKEYSPHIDNLLGAFSYQAAIMTMLEIMTAPSPCNVFPAQWSSVFITTIDSRVKKADGFFTVSRYGNSTSGVVPFPKMAESVKKYSSTSGCVTGGTDYHDSYACLRSDELFLLFDRITAVALSDFTSGSTVSQTKLENQFHILMAHLFDVYFGPMSDNIVELIVSTASASVPFMVGLIVACIVLILIIEVRVLFSTKQFEKEERFTLKLLLHCPVSALNQSPRISSLLGGNFEKQCLDQTNRNSEYFLEIFHHMPDAFIVFSPGLSITDFNLSASRLFELPSFLSQNSSPPETPLNLHTIFSYLPQSQQNTAQNIQNLQNLENFEEQNENLDSNGNPNQATKQSQDQAHSKLDNDKTQDQNDQNSKEHQNQSQSQYKNSQNHQNNQNQNYQNQNEQNLENLLEYASENECMLSIAHTDGTVVDIRATKNILKSGEIILTLHDITQRVRYNRLIAEERMKSDQMLASILPAKLVPRVRDGESDINFAVQSASIVFMDIVEFTPWCASLTATEVMNTLNLIYSSLDSMMLKYPTMTKIKCIGDCYMAAGGIFAEINQPEIHARESVEFGLDSILEIQKIDEEMGLDRKIRVGINTGGPIVAGVLGTEKPTFEIIGPAINMAQQMEHHGVAMMVHISRPVYEMIYGGPYDIKERGEIEIKNGTAITYLVTKKLVQ